MSEELETICDWCSKETTEGMDVGGGIACPNCYDEAVIEMEENQ